MGRAAAIILAGLGLAPGCAYRACMTYQFAQAVAGPEELYVFLEVQQRARTLLPWHLLAIPIVPTPEAMAFWLGGDEGVLATSQEVIVLGPEGLRRRIPLSILNGRTFHPNLSHIVGLEDGFYLYSGESGSTYRSLFKWQDNHFRRLPLEESERLLLALRAAMPTIGHDIDALEEAGKAAGWQPVTMKLDYCESRRRLVKRFQWQGMKTRLEWDNRWTGATVRILPEEPADRFKPVVLEYPNKTPVLSFIQVLAAPDQGPEQEAHQKPPGEFRLY